jgi:hypothetical protein
MRYAEQLLVCFYIIMQVDYTHLDLFAKLLLELEWEMAAETHDLVAALDQAAGQVATDEAVGPEYSYNSHFIPVVAYVGPS